MKIRKILIFLIITLASIFILGFSNKVNAFTITDDGEYTLILNLLDDGEIDGQTSKAIRFNVDEGEDTILLSEITKGIEPFNCENEFEGWTTDMTQKANEELKISEFNRSGFSGDIKFTKGLILWGRFSDRPLQGTGTYYISLDPFAGKLNGKEESLILSSKSTEFKTVDLSEYKPVREGYTFVGWGYNGQFVNTIDADFFKNRDALKITATYISNTFEGDYVTLTLNANGGTIDGKDSNKYDYVGGSNSGTSMSIFQYVPVREGYTFNGWNTKSDGTGKTYKYMYWASWRNDGESIFERDTLEDNMYKNITLYASWTKNSETPITPEKPETEPEKTIIKSIGKIKGEVEFSEEVNTDYKLDIKQIEIAKELADKNIKYLVDINLLIGNEIVPIDNTKMKIRIEIPEELKGYNTYKIVYISNNEIQETIPATIEDGYIVFETTHLSEYGIIAENIENETITENTKETKIEETSNPKTGDNIVTSIILFATSITAIGVIAIVKKHNK